MHLGSVYKIPLCIYAYHTRSSRCGVCSLQWTHACFSLKTFVKLLFAGLVHIESSTVSFAHVICFLSL